ncbi:unnamed protein product [Ambrosiozyma monospora]|uniref:Unnamed protein product n=1 Tax=Ambrosiozyma monospora TaxID=43982 RepID=A0ACB5T8X2_AMBMO|nr:unnamed protein product [Ambrosiozyma monospora]
MGSNYHNFNSNDSTIIPSTPTPTPKRVSSPEKKANGKPKAHSSKPQLQGIKEKTGTKNKENKENTSAAQTIRQVLEDSKKPHREFTMFTCLPAGTSGLQPPGAQFQLIAQPEASLPKLDPIPLPTHETRGKHRRRQAKNLREAKAELQALDAEQQRLERRESGSHTVVEDKHAPLSIPLDTIPTQFPKDFKPREAANMHHTEKVNNWIVQVPIHPDPANSENWLNECYPAVVGITDEIMRDEEIKNLRDANNGIVIDLSTENEIREYQARLITILVNTSYFKDPEHVRMGGIAENHLRSLSRNYIDSANRIDVDLGEDCRVSPVTPQYTKNKSHRRS